MLLYLKAVLVTYAAHFNYFTSADALMKQNYQLKCGLFVCAILSLRLMLILQFANLEALKKIYSPTRDGSCYNNHYESLKNKNVPTVTHLRELRRAGHVILMGKN
jgi:hypothetical protein